MPKEIQQKAGIEKLNPEEKKALAEWLQEKKTPAPELGKSPLTLSENRFDGKVLQLSDGSLWEISPDDLDRSSLWLTPFPVKVERTDHPKYPYKIVNMYTGSSVKAKKTVPGDKP